MKSKYLVITLLIGSFMVGCGPTAEEKEKEEKEISTQKRLTIETILEEYNDCSANAESRNDCKNFTARAICEYYGIDDLKVDGEYVEYHAIFDFVTTDASLEKFGYGNGTRIFR